MTRTISQIATGNGSDELRRDDYFPTLIYSINLHDAEDMNREILAAIYDERERDSKGIERSNFRSLGGWHSHNNLHKEARFKRLTDRAHKMLAGIHENLLRQGFPDPTMAKCVACLDALTVADRFHARVNRTQNWSLCVYAPFAGATVHRLAAGDVRSRPKLVYPRMDAAARKAGRRNANIARSFVDGPSRHTQNTYSQIRRRLIPYRRRLSRRSGWPSLQTHAGCVCARLPASWGFSFVASRFPSRDRGRQGCRRSAAA